MMPYLFDLTSCLLHLTFCFVKWSKHDVNSKRQASVRVDVMPMFKLTSSLLDLTFCFVKWSKHAVISKRQASVRVDVMLMFKLTSCLLHLTFLMEDEHIWHNDCRWRAVKSSF